MWSSTGTKILQISSFSPDNMANRRFECSFTGCGLALLPENEWIYTTIKC